jgi:hypothetical protein
MSGSVRPTTSVASGKAQTARNPNEFRRYRQGLFAVYLTVGGLAILLVGASVVRGLFFSRGEKRQAPSPTDLLACNDDVRKLLEDLGEKAAELQVEAVKGEVQDLGRRWDEFARTWQKEWEEVNVRCRFDELANTDQVLAYERMATAHRDLVALKLEYGEMIARFGKDQARDLARMREALDRSRVDLLKAVPAPETVPNDQSDKGKDHDRE